MIGEKGYASASVDEIARRAGLSRSTVYGYFPRKEDLLTGCLAAGREVLSEVFERSIDREASFEEQLTSFVAVCLSRVDTSREFFLAIAGLESLPVLEEGAGGSELAGLIKDFDDELSRILHEGLRQGELPQAVDPAARDCLAILIMGAMTARSRLTSPPPVQEAAARLVRFALPGMKTPPSPG